MLLSLLLLLGAALWTLGESVSRSPEEAPQSCCEIPIEIVEEGRVRVGCRGERELAGCGALEAGDRVVLGKACRVVPGGMSAGLRLLQGLGLDLNRASASDLELLDGIGPTLARTIVEHREASGAFESVEQLVEVKGIGPVTLEKLRRHLWVRGPTP